MARPAHLGKSLFGNVLDAPPHHCGEDAEEVHEASEAHEDVVAPSAFKYRPAKGCSSWHWHQHSNVGRPPLTGGSADMQVWPAWLTFGVNQPVTLAMRSSSALHTRLYNREFTLDFLSVGSCHGADNTLETRFVTLGSCLTRPRFLNFKFRKIWRKSKR